MNQLSKNEWLGVGVAIVIVIVFLGPGLGLFGNRAANNPEPMLTNTGTTTEPVGDNETPRSFSVVPGVKAQVLREGTGDTAEKGRVISVHYRGQLADGTVFDSSYDRGQPFEFPLGAGQVIRGWDEGVAGMKEGEVRRLEIAPEYGYGAQGVTNPYTGETVIPGNAVLVFDVELLDAGIGAN